MNLNWRKSSYSGGEGNCVEVANNGNRVLVRDTKNKADAMLRFHPDAWRRFADQVKGGRSLASDLPPTLLGALSCLSGGCPPSLCQHPRTDQRLCLGLIHPRLSCRNIQLIQVIQGVLHAKRAARTASLRVIRNSPIWAFSDPRLIVTKVLISARRA